LAIVLAKLSTLARLCPPKPASRISRFEVAVFAARELGPIQSKADADELCRQIATVREKAFSHQAVV